MIKLSEILLETLLEKKLCPKGKAYYDRRVAAGEKPSAYLSGRAVKVCKGLMEEDDLVNEINLKTIALTTLLGLSGISNIQAKVSPKTSTAQTLEDGGKILEKLVNKLKKDGYELEFGVSLDAAKKFFQSGNMDNIKVVEFAAENNNAARMLANQYIRQNNLKPFQTLLLHKDSQHILVYIDKEVNESLRDWFEKEDWVRIDTQGNITGPCGTMKKGKATTRCLPRAKANSLTKAERAATARKKVAGSKKGKQFVPNTEKAKVKFNK